MNQFQIFNGPSPTDAAQAKLATGTAIKTLLQVRAIAAAQMRIIEWGISFDGSAAATPIICELIDTATVFATVTAHAAAGVIPFDDPNAPTPSTFFTLSTSGTGYNASGEGTITASRMFDAQLVAPTNQYIKQFPLGAQPKIAAGRSLRIRVTAGASVNALCYVIVEV